MNTFKTIKPGQLVTVDNVVYRCRKTNCKDPYKACCICDLKEKCLCVPPSLSFCCDLYTNFKRITL